MVAALAAGWEADVLREGVGAAVVADVAGLLPWATEDTINTRSVLGFWATGGDTEEYERNNTSWELKDTRRRWRKGERSGPLDAAWFDTTGRDCPGSRDKPSFSQPSEIHCAYASTSYEKRD